MWYCVHFMPNVTHEARGMAQSEAARYSSSLSMRLLCAGHARLFVGALRERTKFQIRVKHI